MLAETASYMRVHQMLKDKPPRIFEASVKMKKEIG
jgi:hypothetical protein